MLNSQNYSARIITRVNHFIIFCIVDGDATQSKVYHRKALIADSTSAAVWKLLNKE